MTALRNNGKDRHPYIWLLYNAVKLLQKQQQKA